MAVAGTGGPGFNGDGIPAVTAELYYPSDIAFDKSGNLVIADLGNNRIRSVSNVDAALPITIATFTATTSLHSNKLFWTTGVESSAKGFSIEKSANGNNFQKIGFQPAKGSNSNYAFTDQHPSNRTYYRLQLLALDENSEYSKVLSVVNGAARETISIRPNPAKNIIFIKNTTGTIRIFNAAGQLVVSKISVGAATEIDITALPTGIYFLKDATDETEKFVKQ